MSGRGKVNTCRNCAFGSFERTAGGSLKKTAGDCLFPIQPRVLPACCQNPRPPSKCAIWPSDGKDCPCFEART